jgi:hypothetical protein
MLNAYHISAIADDIFDPMLDHFDFGKIEKLKWVRNSKKPIREIFQLTPMKGGDYWAWWGVSLDFCPHVVGSTSVKWHRTDKSCLFDFFQRHSCGMAISTLGTESGAREQSQLLAETAVPTALRWFEKIQNLESLAEMYEDLINSSKAWEFETMTQGRLSYSFLLKVLGREDEANVEFESYLTKQEPHELVESKLRELFSKTAL